MTQLETTLQARAELAIDSLRQAQRVGDDYLAEVRLSELEDLARIAAAHDVVLPALAALTLDPA